MNVVYNKLCSYISSFAFTTLFPHSLCYLAIANWFYNFLFLPLQKNWALIFQTLRHASLPVVFNGTPYMFNVNHGQNCLEALSL